MIPEEQIEHLQQGVEAQLTYYLQWRDAETGHRMEASVIPATPDLDLRGDTLSFRLLRDDSEVSIDREDVLELDYDGLPHECADQMMIVGADLLKQFDKRIRRKRGQALFAEEKIAIMVRLLHGFLGGVEARMLVHLPHSLIPQVSRQQQLAVLDLIQRARLETGTDPQPGEDPYEAFHRHHQELLQQVSGCTGAFDETHHLPDTLLLFIDYVREQPPLDMLSRDTVIRLYMQHEEKLDLDNYMMELTYVADLDDPTDGLPSPN